MPDEQLPGDRPENGQPTGKTDSLREIARDVRHLVAVLAPIALGAIALVALVLGSVALFWYVLYREWGLLGSIAVIVLTMSVLRLATLYSQRRTGPRP
ncbi:hypothetical protein [Streptomyces violascens]|uniref:hypothetical protein n=1 Tax=Streptomyces violascens TaxID=67381 RepID=UPI00167259A0|nr:hypothetical protein [Streptomyces violascens]GGU49546.1 hypothetical protein GCM10010289_82590 [Streptomyces violascens]